MKNSKNETLKEVTAKNKIQNFFIKIWKGIKKVQNKMPEFNILLIGILFLVVLSFANPIFISFANIKNLLRQTAITGVVAVGMTFVIISAGIDLSVGSILALAGVTSAQFMQMGMPIAVALLLSVLISVVLGIAVGMLVHNGHIPPFIATLGAMSIVRGMVMLLSKANKIPVPESFTNFAITNWFGVPAMVYIWLLVIIVGIVIAKHTTFGRNVYAIGSNEETARLSGVNVGVTLCGIYAFCALCAAIAGFLTLTRLGSANPTAGVGAEMDAIAAVVVGGASLSGAVGSVFGTVIGTVIIAMIRNGGQILKINSFVLDILVGALIVIAVLIDKISAKRKNS